MPRMKSTEEEEQKLDQAISPEPETTGMEGKEKKASPLKEPDVPATDVSTDTTATGDTIQKARSPWINYSAAVVVGVALGFALCYFLLARPVQDQLVLSASVQNDGVTSSNQIKSDLSNTRLRQQEMEIRYIKAAAQLEIANQNIFLLQMKEKVAVAQLMVEKKNGLEARNALADINTLFEHINPYIVEKDAVASADLRSLIQTTIQDLTSDPESAVKDLDRIGLKLKNLETTLF